MNHDKNENDATRQMKQEHPRPTVNNCQQMEANTKNRNNVNNDKNGNDATRQIKQEQPRPTVNNCEEMETKDKEC